MNAVLAYVAGVLTAEARIGVRALLSQNPHYPSAAASMTLGLSFVAVLLTLPAFGIVLWRKGSMPVTAPAAALVWSLACVPLPPSEFWGNGGTDDSLLLLPFLTLIISPVCWLISSRIRGAGAAAVIAQTGLGASVMLVAFGVFVDGFDAKERAVRAFGSAVVTTCIALVALVKARRQSLSG